MQGKLTKTEKRLILAALLFAVCMTGFSARSLPPHGTAAVETEYQASRSAVLPVNGWIDLNKASSAELDTLPGIGAVLADRIVQYRDGHGGFRRIDELKKVKGIGEKKYEAVAGQVTVGEGENG